jgi:integrase
MALELKPASGWWYARFMIRKKLLRYKLNPVEGVRPDSLTKRGDPAFERSRRDALSRHDALHRELTEKRSAEELAQRIMQAKTGSRLDSVKVSALPDVWATIPRKREPSEQHAETTRGKLQRFADFMAKHHPEVVELADCRAEQIRAFLDAEAASGVSARTWNIMLGLLKGVFRKLEPGAEANRRYLLMTPQKVEETVHREPFKMQEVEAVLEAAKGDDLIRSLIVTALCTGMRRGDCARLQWSNVDLDAGFIVVKATKTGATVEIPVLRLLNDTLRRLPGRRQGYVFPEAAALHENNPAALDRRLKAVLWRAGFVDEDTAKRIEKGETSKPRRPDLPALPPEEVRRKGLDAIRAAPGLRADRRDRMADVFTAYMDGKGLPTIAREMYISKSTVSLYLNRVEEMVGARVVRYEERGLPETVRGLLHAAGHDGSRKLTPSIRGWHSFRTTFITVALSAGMPMELVRRITGHATVDVVLKHYFRPGRAEFKREFERAMPGLLMTGAKSRDEQLQDIAEGMTAKTWKRDRERILRLLRGEPDKSTTSGTHV